MNGSFPRIKVCGVNDVRFARRAEALGADYLGFIFAQESPRHVSPVQAAEIASALSGTSRLVGVFTHSTVAEMLEIADAVPLDVMQLHSVDYGADEIRRLHGAGFEVWQLCGSNAAMHTSAGVGRLMDGWRPMSASAECLPDALLLDGEREGMTGGTGMPADWRRAEAMASAGIRVALAGGISADNAVEAAKTGCAILDVNSSLETGRAVKSTALLERFFDAIRPYR